MSVTLDKVDEVRNRTGASYGEAKEALEFTNGDVLEAVIYIEQLRQDIPRKDSFTDDLSQRGAEIMEVLKDLVKRGQVTRILLEKGGKTILDIPVVAGAVGALIFTGATAVGILAALATGCDMKIVKENNDIVDIREILEETADTVKGKAEDVIKHFTADESKSEDETTEDTSEEDSEDDNVVIHTDFMTNEMKKDDDKE